MGRLRGAKGKKINKQDVNKIIKIKKKTQKITSGGGGEHVRLALVWLQSNLFLSLSTPSAFARVASVVLEVLEDEREMGGAAHTAAEAAIALLPCSIVFQVAGLPAWAVKEVVTRLPDPAGLSEQRRMEELALGLAAVQAGPVGTHALKVIKKMFLEATTRTPAFLDAMDLTLFLCTTSQGLGRPGAVAERAQWWLHHVDTVTKSAPPSPLIVPGLIRKVRVIAAADAKLNHQNQNPLQLQEKQERAEKAAAVASPRTAVNSSGVRTMSGGRLQGEGVLGSPATQLAVESAAHLHEGGVAARSSAIAKACDELEAVFNASLKSYASHGRPDPPFDVDFPLVVPGDAALQALTASSTLSPAERKQLRKSSASLVKPLDKAAAAAAAAASALPRPEPLSTRKKVDYANLALPRPRSAHYRREHTAAFDVDSVCVQADNIWFQVDPRVNRLHGGELEEAADAAAAGDGAAAAEGGGAAEGELAPVRDADVVAVAAPMMEVIPGDGVLGSSYPEDDAEAVLLSETPGVLAMTKRALFWVPAAASAAAGAPVFNALDFNQDDTSRMQILLSDVERWSFGKISKGVHYLLLHTDAAFKFFPFYDGEVQELGALLADLTGKPQFDEKAFIQKVISEELVSKRVGILQALSAANPDDEWVIRDNRELLIVLSKLTAGGNKPQTLFDLERLYHSCRLNKEVTKEAFVHLRHRWNEAKDEIVRKKVLAVVDRLLDPAVTVVGDVNFATISGWIRRVSEMLDPYTSSESVKILKNLTRRIEAFKKQPITGIPDTKIAEFFDEIADLATYQSYHYEAARAIANT
jgi:hypothetical protein